MIKDCIEDYLMLLALHRRDLHKPQLNVPPTGLPTVEEVEKISNVYYGPPKVNALHVSGSL